MSLSIHINFNGQCQEAFAYYAEHLGGTLGTLLSYQDSPLASSVPAEWQHKILHANISINGVELAGGDVMPEQYQKPSGFCLLLGVNSADEVDSVFNKLAEGGSVIMPPQKTFWSPCYAIVVDRFGVGWKINGT